MNKKEFKELDREQMIIAFNQLKDDYSSLFDELEKEKEKNKTKVDITDIEFSNFIKERYVSKDRIKNMMKYREFELQQEYKEFEEDVEWRTYKKILEEK